MCVFYLGFTPYKVDLLIQGMYLQQKAVQND